jgi:TolA-binding protein
MRRLTLAVIALTLAGTHPLPAAETPKGGVSVSSVKSEKPKRSFESWLKDLKKRVARTRARPNQLVAVAAVRGEEKDIAPKLYWKGKKSEGPVAASELDDFENAIDAALAGQPEATSKLQAFISAYPKSSLGPDAHVALDRLSSGETNP